MIAYFYSYKTNLWTWIDRTKPRRGTRPTLEEAADCATGKFAVVRREPRMGMSNSETNRMERKT